MFSNNLLKLILNKTLQANICGHVKDVEGVFHINSCINKRQMSAEDGVMCTSKF